MCKVVPRRLDLWFRGRHLSKKLLVTVVLRHLLKELFAVVGSVILPDHAFLIRVHRGLSGSLVQVSVFSAFSLILSCGLELVPASISLQN